MKLKELVAHIDPFNKIEIREDLKVLSIENDHREVREGSLFVCIKGYTVDGHDFASEAVKRGALAIISEQALDLSVPVILVKDSSRALAYLADFFYGHPSQKMTMIGITGTNGKTTTSHVIEAILQENKLKTGLIGTIYSKIGKDVLENKNTTPESLTLQKILSRMEESELDSVVMEVSSHALELGRVHGVDFDIALFTNLSQDHLDFHETMEQYASAKSLLFSQLGNRFSSGRGKYAIFNADDKISKELIKTTSAHILTFGIDCLADVMAQDIKITAQGTSFNLITPLGSESVRIKLLGKFNVYNVLAAVTVTLAANLPLATIIKAIENITSVDGRFQLVDGGQDYAVIVDYAHTPDGLENVLQTAKDIVGKRIITVVGCGGNRDKAKRPIMAKIACKYSDQAIFTSDNPRNEDPQEILRDMEAGVSDENYTLIIDRKEAINAAIKEAQPNDVILIAGKGHETTQIIGSEALHFDDYEVALEAIKLFEEK